MFSFSKFESKQLKMATTITISCGFSPVFCNFFRKSTFKKGKALVPHVFNVSETRSKQGKEIVISGKCVRQASVSKAPYNVELSLDETRNVTSALCSCAAGTQGQCKHTAAVVSFINIEREESQTDKHCNWKTPSSRGKSLYPKGETIDNILNNPVPTPKLNFLGPSQNEIQQQIELLEQNSLTSSMLYKVLTAKQIAPVPLPETQDFPEWLQRIFTHSGTVFIKQYFGSIYILVSNFWPVQQTQVATDFDTQNISEYTAGI